MSDESKKVCQDCNHEAEKHDILKEPYGRLCISCIDEGGWIHVEIFFNDYKFIF